MTLKSFVTIVCLLFKLVVVSLRTDALGLRFPRIPNERSIEVVYNTIPGTSPIFEVLRDNTREDSILTMSMYIFLFYSADPRMW
jgi:hypothetical protein